MHRYALVVSLSLLACNQAPEGLSIRLGPTAPSTADDLVLEVVEQAIDPNQKDEVVLETTWSVDGAEQGDLAGAERVPAGRTRAGERWSVSVVAGDGRASAEPVTAEITVENSAPTLELTISKGSPSTTEDLIATATTSDLDEDEVTVAWSWTVDGGNAGWTESTLPSDRTTPGEIWEVTAVPSDGQVEGLAQSARFAITNTVPSVGAARVDPQLAYETTTLSCMGGGWRDADGDPPIYEVSWEVNGSAVGEGPTLDGEAFSRGDEIRCSLTPVDAFSEGERVWSGTIVVRNSLARPLRAELLPAEPTVESVLETEVGQVFDADGDFAVVMFNWYVNDIDIGHKASFLRPLDHGIVKGDEVKVWMRGFDGVEPGQGPARTVTILNAPPTAPSLVVQETGTGLHCALATPATDPDVDDVISYAFAWEREGVAWSGDVTTVDLPGDGIANSNTAPGEVWTCKVTAMDGDGPGTGSTADITLSID